MASNNNSTNKFYLDCPYEEKDEVKALGAQWDGSAKQWFVPRHLFPNLTKFSHWIPANSSNGSRLYLLCPFEEKDQAKEAGAKWDPHAKAWYIQGAFTSKKLKKFSRWLTESSNNDASDLAFTATKVAKAKTTTSRGNANDAATLKISDSMTVSQLQEECKTRGIKGLSGKNKDWLLEQVGVGSTWQTMSMQQVAASTTTTKPTKAKATPNKESSAKKPATKATPKQQSTAKATPANKNKIKKKPSPAQQSSALDIHSLPKVSSSMTVAQLMHELLHRQPQTKGTSNKSKAWFLEQLGEHSIWSTSTEAAAQDLSLFTLVSSSQTIAQLTHEIMARKQQAGETAKGLSGKNKQDLIKLLGEGSILTTGVVSSDLRDSAKTKKGATPAKAPPKKKASSSTKPTKQAANNSNNKKKPDSVKSTSSNNNYKRPPKPDAARSTSSVSTGGAAMNPTPVPVRSSSACSSIGAKRTEQKDQDGVLVLDAKREPVPSSATSSNAAAPGEVTRNNNKEKAKSDPEIVAIDENDTATLAMKFKEEEKENVGRKANVGRPQQVASAIIKEEGDLGSTTLSSAASAKRKGKVDVKVISIDDEDTQATKVMREEEEETPDVALSAHSSQDTVESTKRNSNSHASVPPAKKAIEPVQT